MATILLSCNLYFMEGMQPVVEPKKVISPAVILAIVAVIIVALIVYASNKSTSSVTLNDQIAPVDESGTVIADGSYNDEDSSGDDEDDATTPKIDSSTKTAPVITQTSVTFADGTYSAEGDYSAPSGAEHINVTLVLKDNVVTASTVTAATTQSISLKMQNDFIANYKTLVIGKKITDINLGKVSGSSLTPIGFNDAVAKIEAQAKV